MVMTRDGIYHNLDNSTYAISNGEIALFFSSELYRGKFMSRYKDNRKVFEERVKRSMDCESMNLSLLSDIHLYKEIEKRGYRAFLFNNMAKIVELNKINIEKGELDWQKSLTFALVKMIEKSSRGWSEISRVKCIEQEEHTTLI